MTIMHVKPADITDYRLRNPLLQRVPHFAFKSSTEQPC